MSRPEVINYNNEVLRLHTDSRGGDTDREARVDGTGPADMQ